MRKFSRFAAVLALVLVLAVSSALAAGGSPSNKDKEPGVKGDPLAAATQSYNLGLSFRDRAWKMEARAAEASSEAEKTKFRGKARKQYEKAQEEFQTAVAKNPSFHEAFSSLGYTLRKTGNYEAAMAAYDRALELNPSYTEAIEYRGEAYVELGRTEEAKEAYMQLFGQDRAKANMLLASMKSWLAENPDTELATWVAGREEIAGQTASLAELKQRKW